MHLTLEPAIQYWGTPVLLITTLNENGTVNVAPMSSAWWLGWSCMLGFDASSQTVVNMRRSGECVLNVASEANLDAVNALALKTGSPSVPLHKRALGYRFERNKLERAGLTTTPSLEVKPPRVAECAVQLEAVVERVRPFAQRDVKLPIPACSVEVRIVRTHVDEALVSHDGKVDPSRWRALVMNFRELCVVGPPTPGSRLARGDDSGYAPWKRGPAFALAARVLGAVARSRWGVPEGDEETTS